MLELFMIFLLIWFFFFTGFGWLIIALLFLIYGHVLLAFVALGIGVNILIQ